MLHARIKPQARSRLRPELPLLQRSSFLMMKIPPRQMIPTYRVPPKRAKTILIKNRAQAVKKSKALLLRQTANPPITKRISAAVQPRSVIKAQPPPPQAEQNINNFQSKRTCRRFRGLGNKMVLKGTPDKEKFDLSLPSLHVTLTKKA